MKMFFESVNRRVRASQLRTAGRENARAGYQGLADVCFDMADLLDPPPPPESKDVKRRARSKGKIPASGTQGVTVHNAMERSSYGNTRSGNRGNSPRSGVATVRRGPGGSRVGLHGVARPTGANGSRLPTMAR